VNLPTKRADWPYDAKDAYEERAGIKEFDARLAKAEAEVSAESATREAYLAYEEAGQ
jgi:hypothetical protein